MLSVIWRSAYTRCQLLLRRPIELSLLLLALPVLILFMAQFAEDTSFGSEIPIAIVDQDQSTYSQWVIERFSQHSLVRVQHTDQSTAIEMVQKQEVEAAFIIQPGFMENILQGKHQDSIELWHSPASFTAGMLRELLASEVLRLLSNGQAADFIRDRYLALNQISAGQAEALWQEAWLHSDSYWKPEPLMSIDYKEWGFTLQKGEEGQGEEEKAERSGMRESATRLVGWLSVLLMLLAIFLQQWLVEEKQAGVAQRVQSFPGATGAYLAGHALPIYVLIFADMLLTLLLLDWLYPYGLLTSMWLLVLLCLYATLCFTLGFCLASWAKTSRQLQGVGITVVALSSIFGGALLPLAEWTNSFYLISQGTPQGWLLKAVRGGYSAAMDMSLIWSSAALLFGFSILFLILGLWRWRST